eukprot:scaffold5637_cov121-Isochrysis_galbana.AAC.3
MKAKSCASKLGSHAEVGSSSSTRVGGTRQRPKAQDGQVQPIGAPRGAQHRRRWVPMPVWRGRVAGPPRTPSRGRRRAEAEPTHPLQAAWRPLLNEPARRRAPRAEAMTCHSHLARTPAPSRREALRE